MTESKEKPFLDWLFGVSPDPQVSLQLCDAHLRIEELQAAMERERASGLAELEALRVSSRTEAAAERARCETELQRANHELLTMKTALESAQTEIARLMLVAEEARKASARDNEARRKLTGRCSALQFELDKLRSLLEAKSRSEADLEQKLLHQLGARDEAHAALAAQRDEWLQQEQCKQELEQAAARANSMVAELELAARTRLNAHQAEAEQYQKELAVARADVGRLESELQRRQATFMQASDRQQTHMEAERRAWATWVGEVWNTLLQTLGPAAPLALETCLGAVERVARATTTEAAEARLREFMTARSLCRDVAIVMQQSELRLELTPGPALEGTAAGWAGILATRQLAAMLRRPLRTRAVERAGALLTVYTASGAGNPEPVDAAVEEAH